MTVVEYIETEAAKRDGEVRTALLAIASNIAAGLHEEDVAGSETSTNHEGE